MSLKCPLCSNELLRKPDDDFETNGKIYSCPNCGCFELSLESQNPVSRIALDNPEKLPMLSHAVRKMNERQGRPKLTMELIYSILSTSQLPSPTEQVENLLLWLGDNSGFFGERIQVAPETHTAIIGAANRKNYHVVARELVNRGLCNEPGIDGLEIGALSFDGWQKYEELRRGRTTSRKAFMAMAYGNEVLDRIFIHCFKPVVAATGFSLHRLDEAPPAGLIDDWLRVEIRTSCFLIADLTGGNQGAYWEAGFAEGLGKPVIFTCKENYFQEHSTHFDTSHHHTVLWNEDDLASAATLLKTTIRATLPSEAVMEDSEGPN